jgi:hypothetical protein
MFIDGNWKVNIQSCTINPLTPELNLSVQRCLPRFLLGILIFKGFSARRLYKSLGVKGLITFKMLLKSYICGNLFRANSHVNKCVSPYFTVIQ